MLSKNAQQNKWLEENFDIIDGEWVDKKTGKKVTEDKPKPHPKNLFEKQKTID